jgi:hypothetical protein
VVQHLQLLANRLFVARAGGDSEGCLSAGFGPKLLRMDLQQVQRDLMLQLLPALDAAASPELVMVLCTGGQLGRWLANLPLLLGTRTWEVWTQLVAGVLEVAGSRGAGWQDARRLLAEVRLRWCCLHPWGVSGSSTLGVSQESALDTSNFRDGPRVHSLSLSGQQRAFHTANNNLAVRFSRFLGLFTTEVLTTVCAPQTGSSGSSRAITIGSSGSGSACISMAGSM